MWAKNYDELSKLNSAERSRKDFKPCEENRCKYVAKNVSGDDVIKINLDKDIPPEYDGDKRVDYVFLNETKKIAYLVELKCSNIKKAFEQLENTDQKLRGILEGYKIRWRVVCNPRTAKLRNNDIQKKINGIKKRRNFIISKDMTLFEDLSQN